MASKIEAGSIVEGKVVRIKPFGAIVSLGSGQLGLVHISQITSAFVKDINEYVAVGDMVKVKVLSIDEGGTKIALSMRAAEPKPPEAEKPDSAPVPESAPAASQGFEDKMKEWLKQSSERQTTINKRMNKRYM